MKSTQPTLPLLGRGFLTRSDRTFRVVEMVPDFVKQNDADVRLTEEWRAPVLRRSTGDDVIDDEKDCGGV